MKKIIPITLFLFLASACQFNTSPKKTEHFKKEILETEQAFAETVAEKGMRVAFMQFAADSAVLYRNDTIVKGKTAIQSHFEQQTLSNIELYWVPDFVDVSAFGDLAYTYGKYQFTAMDSLGNKIVAEGIFHTVWKRQKDGSWKFVWD